MYELVRRILFCLEAETSHELSLDLLGAASRLGLVRLLAPSVEARPVQVMGLTFPNRVGMAAGLDKNGDYFNALGQLGFGFVEIGTITPRPQPGNPKPRLFRLAQERAIINRMGFNNEGVEHLKERVRHRIYDGILGINIGKNLDTPVEKAGADYRYCMEAVYPLADYVTVNISSPNTPGLRNLQFGDTLKRLLDELKQSQQSLQQKHGRYVPLALKIAPDMEPADIVQVASALVESGIDAVIASNTTLSREGVETSPYRQEAGGLSGAPLREKSTAVIRSLAAELGGKIPIVGVGGIFCADDAVQKLDAGASLVQLYSGFIYRGPRLVRECVEALAQS